MAGPMPRADNLLGKTAQASLFRGCMATGMRHCSNTIFSSLPTRMFLLTTLHDEGPRATGS